MSKRKSSVRDLSHPDLLELKRWNSPTIYNGWEQITDGDIAADAFNIEETCDFMPQMGSMVGYAITVVCEPGNPEHAAREPDPWEAYLEYVASLPSPKIVIVQDLDKPSVIGSFWGEVNANIHRALGCVGTITDGAIRDLDEMNNAGFKALARRLCVGHAHVAPIKWNCEVEVFGRKVLPHQLIHADKHGFLAIPKEDETRLLEAARFMDSNECKTVISTARESAGRSTKEILDAIKRAEKQFGEAAMKKFGRRGEW